MNIKQFLVNKEHCTIIKHHSPDPGSTPASSNKAVRQRELLLDRFLKYAKPILVTSMVSVAGMASMSTYASDLSHTHAETQQAHLEIQKTMSPGWDHYQGFAGNGSMTIVDMNDPNLVNIIDAAPVDLLPEGVHPGSMTKMFSVFSSEEELKKEAVLDHLKKLASAPVALGTYDARDMGKLCFVQADLAYDAYSFGHYKNETPISVADSEFKLGTRAHEVAHCLDLSMGTHGNVDLKKETLADAASMIYMASQTGNWDYLDHSLGAMRLATTSQDHSTLEFLNAIKSNIDINTLEPMNLESAFDRALQETRNIDFWVIQDLNLKNQQLASDYSQYTRGDLNWESMPWHDVDDYTLYGVDSAESFHAIMEQEGIRQLESYLNHLNYKSLENTPIFAEAALEKMERHAVTFSNEIMKQVVIDQKAYYNATGSIDIQSISEATGLTVDLDAKSRYETNLQTIQGLYENTSPKRSLNQQASAIENIHTEIEVHKNAKTAFLDRLGMNSLNKGFGHHGMS